MSDRIVIRVSKEAIKIIRAKAEAAGIDYGEAADNLILHAPANSKVISPEQLNQIKDLAALLEKTVPETLDRLIKMGISRHFALANYAVQLANKHKKTKTARLKRKKPRKPSKPNGNRTNNRTKTHDKSNGRAHGRGDHGYFHQRSLPC